MGRLAEVVVMIALVVPAPAQTLTVYSEFTRTDPFGKPVRADRGPEPPREILSPAVARGAVSSFHVVVEGSPGEPFTLQVAQNPDAAFTVTAYRELYTKRGAEWIPDELEPVSLPYDSRIGADGAIPGQTAVAFWVDLAVRSTAPVRRVKVEPQAYMRDGWVRYPMEVRVRNTRLGPAPMPAYAGVPDVLAPSGQSALAAWRSALCGGASGDSKAQQPLSVRSLIARNSGQDVRLAGTTLPPELLRLLGVSNRDGFCGSGKLALSGQEDYLRVRDLLIGARE
jgi:hypothetical protein